MITDQETNKVFFSEYLKAYKCWKSIEAALNEQNIQFELLPNTKDIWVRDFMPIQIDESSYVSYVYNPDYLRDNKKYITTDVSSCYDFSGIHLLATDTVIDGGNVIKCDDKVIMTDKIFVENNDKNPDELIEYLERCFRCKVVIIPWDKEERCGHSDGMVRYVDPGHVVINHYCDIDEPLREKMLLALSHHFPKISELKYGKNARMNSWAHLNFLRVGNILFVPQMGIASDTLALEQLKDIFQDCSIIPIETNGIVKNGGALNCVSWNIKE